MLERVIDESPLLVLRGENFRKIGGTTRFRPLVGTEAAWFDQTWEERNNPAGPAAVLVMRNVGFVCVHPFDKNCGIFMYASHRIERGATPALDAPILAEDFARQLTISPPK
jgi:hypothetical protein